jgi:hypothetical protein
MRELSASELLQVWEWGEKRHPIDQALAILVAALPDKHWDELTHLPLGQRDSYLYAIRARLFGPRLAGYAPCPACGTELQFDLETSALTMTKPQTAQDVRVFQSGDLEIDYRHPDSLDLAQVAQASSAAAAQALLLERVITGVRQSGVDVPVRSIPPETGVQLQAFLLEQEPLLEVRLDLTCPACDHNWQVLLDIATFFWSEIAARASRLLREVHLLARAYGWPEADILALSDLRRAKYLEMVLA